MAPGTQDNPGLWFSKLFSANSSSNCNLRKLQASIRSEKASRWLWCLLELGEHFFSLCCTLRFQLFKIWLSHMLTMWVKVVWERVIPLVTAELPYSRETKADFMTYVSLVTTAGKWITFFYSSLWDGTLAFLPDSLCKGRHTLGIIYFKESEWIPPKKNTQEKWKDIHIRQTYWTLPHQ